jgi:hypothetical protein
MVALNSSRDPFYYTMYVGVPVLLLAAGRDALGRPRTVFWAVVSRPAPSRRSARTRRSTRRCRRWCRRCARSASPVKYLSLASFGLATLAAVSAADAARRDRAAPRGPHRVDRRRRRRGWSPYVAIAWVLLAPTMPIHGFYRPGGVGQGARADQGAEFLLFRARPAPDVAAAQADRRTFLLGDRRLGPRERRLALVVLAIVGDGRSARVNSSVNPTLDATLLAEPAWLNSVPREMHERVYVGGRVEGVRQRLRHRRAEVRLVPGRSLHAAGAAPPDRGAARVLPVRRAHA